MKIKREHETMTGEFEELLETNDWTLVITESLTGFYVTIEGEGLPRPNPDKDPLSPKFLPLGCERPTEKQAINALKIIMREDGYFE